MRRITTPPPVNNCLLSLLYKISKKNSIPGYLITNRLSKKLNFCMVRYLQIHVFIYQCLRMVVIMSGAFFIDYSKAYHVMNCSILLELTVPGLNCSVFFWIANFLCGRTRSTTVFCHITNNWPFSRSIDQGLCIGSICESLVLANLQHCLS